MTNTSGLGGPEHHHTHQGRSQPRPERPQEWPTWGLLAVCYGGWLSLTYAYEALPIWFFAPFAAYLVALHSSLQHEVLHGHPTRNASVNEALVYFPVGFLVPYRRFKTSHLRHHCDERLTDPYDDPESWYVCPNQWDQISQVMKGVLTINATLAGRLIIGPGLAFVGLVREDTRAIASGDRAIARAWMHHAIGLTIVVTWLIAVCEIPIWVYIITAAYPGMSLLLIRSYAEHRAAENPDFRTVIIETSPVFSLLFLNNNLHFVHHKHPRVAWYKLPSLYRNNRDQYFERNGGYEFQGYGDMFRKHLLRPVDRIIHPLRTRTPE